MAAPHGSLWILPRGHASLPWAVRAEWLVRVRLAASQQRSSCVKWKEAEESALSARGTARLVRRRLLSRGSPRPARRWRGLPPGLLHSKYIGDKSKRVSCAGVLLRTNVVLCLARQRTIGGSRATGWLRRRAVELGNRNAFCESSTNIIGILRHTHQKELRQGCICEGSEFDSCRFEAASLPVAQILLPTTYYDLHTSNRLFGICVTA